MPTYFPAPFQASHERADPRICGKAGIELRLVRVVQHIHDVRAAHAWRIVKPGMLEAARLQIGDAAVSACASMSSLVPNTMACVGQAFDAGRLLADRDPVGAQRALVGCVDLARCAGC